MALATNYGYYGPHHSLVPPYMAGLVIVVLLLIAVLLIRD